MSKYSFPNTYAEENSKSEGPVKSTATGFGGMQAITQKGPIGIPLRHRTFKAWTKVFGEREKAERGDAAYEAKLFFDEGGFELITIRQGHYNDITDKDSVSGRTASVVALTQGVGSSAAEKVTGSAAFNLSKDDTVILGVDAVAPVTITFQGDPGHTDDTTSYPVADQDGKTIQVGIDGGSAKTITFSGVTTEVSSVASQINAQLVGGRAIVKSGQLSIISDTVGTGSTVSVTVGTSDLTFDPAVAGSGDAVDLAKTTIAELKTKIEAETAAIVSDNGNNTATIQSNTVGASSTLDFTGGTALPALGLSVETITGTDSGATYDTLKIETGYHGFVSPGVYGNAMRVQIKSNPRRKSIGAGMDIASDIAIGDTSIQVTSHAGINSRSVIKLWDGTNVEYKIVTEVKTKVEAGTVKFYVDVLNAFSQAFVVSSAQLETTEFDILVYEGLNLVETLRDNSMLDTADNYVETLVNDESIGSQFIVVTDLDANPPGLGFDTPAENADPVLLGGGTDEVLGMTNADWIGDEIATTGLFAWGSINEFITFCTPGMNETAVVNAAAEYARRRIWFSYATYIDIGMSKEDAIAYRNNVLGVDSSYCFLYAGGCKVYDPKGVGSNPRRSLSGLGLVMGVMSRVDDLPEPSGGPWQTPAGMGDYGDSRSALDVATEYSEADAGEMNLVGINNIFKFSKTDPVRLWGARTLDASVAGEFKYIATRRFFQYVEKSIVESTRWGVFRNNDFRLWEKLKDAADSWLRSLMPAGAYPTPVKELAYFVKMGIDDGTMVAQDIDDGNVIGEIGIAPNKPGEFIIYRFSQFDSGWDVIEGI